MMCVIITLIATTPTHYQSIHPFTDTSATNRHFLDYAILFIFSPYNNSRSSGDRFLAYLLVRQLQHGHTTPFFSFSTNNQVSHVVHRLTFCLYSGVVWAFCGAGAFQPSLLTQKLLQILAILLVHLCCK